MRSISPAEVEETIGYLDSRFVHKSGQHREKGRIERNAVGGEF